MLTSFGALCPNSWPIVLVKFKRLILKNVENTDMDRIKDLAAVESVKP